MKTLYPPLTLHVTSPSLPYFTTFSRFSSPPILFLHNPILGSLFGLLNKDHHALCVAINKGHGQASLGHHFGSHTNTSPNSLSLPHSIFFPLVFLCFSSKGKPQPGLPILGQTNPTHPICFPFDRTPSSLVFSFFCFYGIKQQQLLSISPSLAPFDRPSRRQSPPPVSCFASTTPRHHHNHHHEVTNDPREQPHCCHEEQPLRVSKNRAVAASNNLPLGTTNSSQTGPQTCSFFSAQNPSTSACLLVRKTPQNATTFEHHHHNT